MQILLEEANWSMFSEADADLYKYCFTRASDDWAYENNWSFIKQEARYAALKYYDGELLLTIVSKNDDSPFLFAFISFCEKKENAVNTLIHIASQIASLCSKRLVVRKIPQDLATFLLQSGYFVIISPGDFIYANELPEDIYPQVIIDIKKALDCKGGGWVKTRNMLKYFKNSYSYRVEDLSKINTKDAERAVESWSNDYISKFRANHDDKVANNQIIDPTAFTMLATEFASNIDNQYYFSKVLYVDAQPVGFTFAGRVSNTCSALYSSIASTRYRGSPEFLLCQLLQQIFAANISFMNMGGSEKEGLYLYKKKFRPVLLRSTYDLVFSPKERGLLLKQE